MEDAIKEYLRDYPDTTMSGVYGYSSGSLNALVQPFKDGILILYVKGKGITKEIIAGMGYTIYCEPKTKAHARLYKSLGFIEEEGHLVWRK